jgi:hypothetical protein
MTAILFVIAISSTLLGQILGYVGKKKPSADKFMFACWVITALSLIGAFSLNLKEAKFFGSWTATALYSLFGGG